MGSQDGRHVDVANLVIGVLGLLLAAVGLPAAIGYLFGQSIVVAILIGVIVGGIVLIIVVGYFGMRRYLNRPPYTLLESEVDLRFLDPKGNRANVLRTDTIKVNQRELGSIRIGRIFSDGSIDNVRVDNRPIDEHPDVRTHVESGALYLVKDFHPPLMRGQTDATTFSFDVLEGFRMNPAGLNQNIAPETKKLRLRVHFHEQRCCRSPKAYLRYSGLIHKSLPDPEVFNHGSRLVYEIKRPKRGEEYRIQWHW